MSDPVRDAGDVVFDNASGPGPIVNVFDDDRASVRYAAGRPDMHGVILSMVGEMIGGAGAVPDALDVACGTGLSTRALSGLAHRVVGSDVGLPMLRRAVEGGCGHYAQATSESLPFRERTFDLLTVGCAFHWFHREQFAAEAARVLRPGGWLVIYDAAFRADMAGRPDFRGWVVDHYVATYPNPPRRKRYEQGEELAGFEHVATRQYEHRLAMTRDRLATYLLSQSNLNVVIAGGTKSEAELRAWLHEQLTQFFGNVATGSFLFGGTISCLRRDS